MDMYGEVARHRGMYMVADVSQTMGRCLPRVGGHGSYNHDQLPLGCFPRWACSVVSASGVDVVAWV